MSERIRGEHLDGSLSGRSFTVEELRAAARLKVAGKQHDKWQGQLFWATGKIHLDNLRRMRDDIAIVLPAWEREWDAWKEQGHETR